MRNESEPLVEGLLGSYRDHGGINHLDGVNLPSKSAVASIAADLLRVLFPGYFEDRPLHSSELGRGTRRMVEELRWDLGHELCKALEFAPPEGVDAGRLEAEAGRLTYAFLERLPEVRAVLATDVEAAYDGDPAARSYEEVIVAYPCIEAVAVQRMAHILYAMGVQLVPRIMTEWAHARTGIDLHPGARIGRSFFIDHGTGVVVGETCRIGDRVKIYQGVTLGAKSFKKDADGRVVKGVVRHPAIEDDVTIYAGATILGGDTVIGARSTVAGNTWLTRSVPPDSLVSSEGQKLVIRAKGGWDLDYAI